MMGSLNNYTGGQGRGDISPGWADHSSLLTSEDALMSIQPHSVSCSTVNLDQKLVPCPSIFYLLFLIKLDAAVF